MFNYKKILIYVCMCISIGVFIYFVFIRKVNKNSLNIKQINPIPKLDTFVSLPNNNHTIALLQPKSIYNKNNENYSNQKNIDFLSFDTTKNVWMYINHILKQKKYEYVIYLASNMKIIDFNKDFRRLIQQGGDNEMILCRDENNPATVNLDAIIFRDSEWSIYKIKQLYWRELNGKLDYDIIMDQIYTDYLPKYKLDSIIVDKGLPYLLSGICVYNEHAFNSVRSNFIKNMKISDDFHPIDIYPWKEVDGYVEVNKNLENLPKKEYDSFKNGRNIPKYIFQTMETSLIPENIYKYGHQKWVKLNPDHAYFFFDSLDRRRFIKENFPLYVFNMYNKLLSGAFKADLWRYCVLYKYGGSYIDMMITPLKSLESIIQPDDKFIASITHVPLLIDQGFLHTTVKNKLLLLTIKNSCNLIDFNNYSKNALYVTGPGLLFNTANQINIRDISLPIFDGTFSDIKLLFHDDSTGHISYNNLNIVKTKFGNCWDLNTIPGWLEHYSKAYDYKRIFKSKCENCF